MWLCVFFLFFSARVYIFFLPLFLTHTHTHTHTHKHTHTHTLSLSLRHSAGVSLSLISVSHLTAQCSSEMTHLYGVRRRERLSVSRPPPHQNLVLFQSHCPSPSSPVDDPPLPPSMRHRSVARLHHMQMLMDKRSKWLSVFKGAHVIYAARAV